MNGKSHHSPVFAFQWKKNGRENKGMTGYWPSTHPKKKYLDRWYPSEIKIQKQNFWKEKWTWRRRDAKGPTRQQNPSQKKNTFSGSRKTSHYSPITKVHITEEWSAKFCRSNEQNICQKQISIFPIEEPTLCSELWTRMLQIQNKWKHLGLE